MQDGSWSSLEDVGQSPAMISLPSLLRIASSNNLNKSESDQEDNDDINDNDWSYGSEKKGGEGSLVSWGVGDTSCLPHGL